MKKSLTTFRFIQFGSAAIIVICAVTLSIENPSDRLATTLLKFFLPVFISTFLYEGIMKRKFGSRISDNLG